MHHGQDWLLKNTNILCPVAFQTLMLTSTRWPTYFRFSASVVYSKILFGMQMSQLVAYTTYNWFRIVLRTFLRLKFFVTIMGSCHMPHMKFPAEITTITRHVVTFIYASSLKQVSFQRNTFLFLVLSTHTFYLTCYEVFKTLFQSFCVVIILHSNYIKCVQLNQSKQIDL
jgi:hypothetical protein